MKELEIDERISLSCNGFTIRFSFVFYDGFGLLALYRRIANPAERDLFLLLFHYIRYKEIAIW